MTRYALATMVREGRPVPAISVDDRLWPLAEAAARCKIGGLDGDVLALIDGWGDSEPSLRRLAEACASGDVPESTAAQPESLRLAAPILYPRKVVAVGANYADHVGRAMAVLEARGYQRPERPPERPAFFMKPPTTAVVGRGAEVPIPRGCTQYDWEIELAVVIGRRTENVAPERALDAVMGYSVSIDMSARDYQIVPESLFKFDLFAGKAFDASCPLGPVVVPAEAIPDPQALHMQLSVNDTLMQDASTAGMTYSTAEVISHLSRLITLEPGDVILTGTPAGTGLESGTFLSAGDRISATIERIGTLEVLVAPERTN